MPSRSRSGCAECKRRKRKCDETRPECLACKKRGIRCGGYNVKLQWSVGIASRGRFVGATMPTLPAQKKFSSSTLASTGKSLASNIHLPRQSCSATGHSAGSAWITCPPAVRNGPPDFASSPTKSSFSSSREQLGSDAASDLCSNAASDLCELPDRCSPAKTPQDRRCHIKRSAEDWYLFDQAMDTTVHRLYGTRRAEWILPLIRSLAETSDALFIVLEALHLFPRHGRDLTVRFHEEVDRALKAFRSELNSSLGTMNGGTMCAGLFLCTLNILLGNPWTSHLKCMADLYQLHGDLGHLMRNGPPPLAIQHPTEIMAVMDLPTLVLGRDICTMGLWERLRQAQDSLEGGRPGGVEVLTGIPRTLLDIFALCGHKSDEDIDVEGKFWSWSWAGETGELPQRHLWEAWRLAGILTARRLQRRKKKHHPAPDGASSLQGQSLNLLASMESQQLWSVSHATPIISEMVLGRLVDCIDTLWDMRCRPEYGHLLVWNSLAYPFTAARLEVTLLRAHPEWLKALDSIASSHFKLGPTSLSMRSPSILKMLDEAMESGDDDYDLDLAAKLQGIEVPLF